MRKIFILLILVCSLNSCYYLLEELSRPRSYYYDNYYFQEPDFRLVCNFRKECVHINVKR